jgi:hypothetical protein
MQMGGKRPDQHNLDPGEGRATDYKFRRRAEEGMNERSSEGGGQPIKPTVPSPEANNPTVKKEQKDEKEGDG